MSTKKQDVLALLDKAVGKKGPLRLPAYWMREVLLKIMDWAEGLTPKVDVPTKISQLENDVALATQSYVNSEINYVANQKQDKITDLSTIRSNAAKGATAIQTIKTINGNSLIGSGDINIDTDISHLATKEEVENSLTTINVGMLELEEVIANALVDLDKRVKALEEKQ